MKHLLIVFLSYLMVSCGATETNNLKSSIDSELSNAIIFGEITDLNKYSNDVDKQLFLRLFQSPLYQEGCLKETHGVCKFEYFLGVSTYDENPETNLYRLKEKGEIVSIDWLPTDEIDKAILQIRMRHYTQKALENNSELTNDERVLRLHVTPTELEEVRAVEF